MRRSIDAAPLPAALAGTLMLAFAVQAMLPIRADMPPVEIATRAAATRARMPMPAAVADRPAIIRRGIFAPSGSGTAVTVGQDIRLLGLARSYSGAAAVVSSSAGSRTVRPGQAIGEWTLLGIGSDSVVLAGPKGRRTLRIGEALAPAVAAPAAGDGEQ